MSFPLLYLTLEIPKIIVNRVLSGGNEILQQAGFVLQPAHFLLAVCIGLLALIIANGWFKMKINTLINEVFTFIDASHLVARANLWQERDQAIGKKLEKLNNQTLPKVAYDKQAKFGAKSKNKFCYGFKKHISVDMQSGLINKVALTPANITDANGLKHVCPASGEVYADKGYCDKQTHLDAKRKGCTLRAILKNNMKDKNTDRDKFISKMRSPYERVFSKTNHRTRYKGVAKNQFAVLMESLAFNFKRRVILEKEYGF